MTTQHMMVGGSKLMIPTVHLNGTGREELERQLQEAANAVQVAMATLAQASPNGLDYYMQPDVDGLRPAIHVAMGQHESRMGRLRSVLDELAAIYEGVVDQEEGR